MVLLLLSMDPSMDELKLFLLSVKVGGLAFNNVKVGRLVFNGGQGVTPHGPSTDDEIRRRTIPLID